MCVVYCNALVFCVKVLQGLGLQDKNIFSVLVLMGYFDKDSFKRAAVHQLNRGK